MATHTYENIGENTVTLMGIGEVEPGKTIQTSVDLNHPFLKKVKAKKDK